jgi:hypothetical protein
MKAIYKIGSLLMIAAVAFLSSCKKDETKVILTPGGDIALTSTATTVVLQQANGASNAVGFTWAPASFGYDAAVTYTLQFSKAGTNFASPATTTEVGMGTALTKTFTVSEFNAKMQEIIPDGAATGVDVRVKASVGNAAAPIYSNVIAMTVTSYLDIVAYTYPAAMNIAGNYQGWDPGSAPQIVNTRNGGYGAYEGYIIFNHATPAFKIVKGNNWGAGDFGGSGGVLTNGGSDITLPSGGPGIAGLYRLRANPTTMTYSFDKINTWGIIGSATPGGWGASTPMIFSPSNGSWTITTNLVVGEMKFRANDDWPINFGDNAPADGKPEYDGNNIPVTVAGNYTITLNIGIGGNYTYKLKKN